MNSTTAPQPPRHHFRNRRLGGVAALVAGSLALLASGCGKKEEPAPAAPPAAPAPASEAPAKPAEPAAPAPKAEAPPAGKPAPAAASSEPARPVPSDEDIAQRVATFKAFHPYASMQEMLRMPQVTTQMAALMRAIMKDPALLARVQAAVPGPHPEPKACKLEVKVANYSPGFADRLLGAVLAGDPGHFADFVLEEKGSIEFVFIPY